MIRLGGVPVSPASRIDSAERLVCSIGQPVSTGTMLMGISGQPVATGYSDSNPSTALALTTRHYRLL